MNTYSEYFDIDKAYYPEINPFSIKDKNIKWQKTFPHKTFIELLKATERMLARGTNADKKGLWIEGAYGTGKSRVAWTLKNLLDCSPDELIEYFNEYDALRPLTDLRDKLLNAKENKIVTVYRYATGDIDSTKKLIMAVYDSVARALDESNIPYKGENTLRGKVATWLEDEIHKEFINSTINKPEYRGLGSFSGKNVDDIILQLNNKKLNVDSLLNDIFVVSENEGINVFNIDMIELTQWLTDVIDENNLKAIVFVWDEFSSFFKNNKNSLDEFQTLAELSNYKPFNLMIVTHMSGSIANESDQAFTTVRDRFVRKEITMPDNIAFELIRHALKVKDAAKEQWDDLSDYLNGLMPESRKAVSEAVNVSEDVLTEILPIHPMAALLLKNISTAFASNQRSMFNFIKNESEDLHAFQWFIDNYSPENEDILTIDYLWEFFYENGTDEHTSGVGRSNLDSIISTILDTYILNEANLFYEDKIILKTVLMMQAISQKFGDSLDLFLPSERNLELAFEGTDFENGYGINKAKALVNKGVLYEKPGKINTFAAAAVFGDQAAIDKIKIRLKKDTRTIQMIENAEFGSIIPLTPGQRFRYEIIPVTNENFTTTINKITNFKEDYHIRAVMCFARTEEDQLKVRDYIKNAIKNPIYKDIVIIDASSNIMGIDRFRQWIEAAANEEYWRPKEGSLADEMKNKANGYINDWKRDITEGDFVFYPSTKKENALRIGISCNKMSVLQSELSENVLRIYPLSFDNAKVTEAFFNSNQLPAAAKRGINQTSGGIYQQKLIELLLKDVWQKGEEPYWIEFPEYPISELKKIVDNYIDEHFQNDVRVEVGDIFDLLISKGFMPCNMYSFLTGFLLKEYTKENYRYGVGISGDEGGKMTSEKLGDFIGEYIKQVNTHNKHYRKKYIEIMTQNQKKFIDFAKEVFDIDGNLAVEQTVRKVRSKLKDLGYPIWCYKKIDTKNLDIFIDKLGIIANSQEESLSSLADTFGGMLNQVPLAIENLNNLLTKGNGVIALERFLNEFEDGIIYDLANNIGINDVSNDVKRQIASGDALWLWDQETGEEEIRKLIIDYKIIDNSIKLNQKCSSWYSCMDSWRTTAKLIKLPYAVMQKEFPELKNFFNTLYEIVENGEIPYEKRSVFQNDLKLKKDTIKTALADAKNIFTEEYSYNLSGFNTEDISTIYAKLPMTSFSDDQATFVKNLSKLVDEEKQEHEKFTLFNKWETLSDSKTPKEWSRKHKTPILVLVSDNEHENAKRLFKTLNSNNPDVGDIKFSLEYLESNPNFINDLKNVSKIEYAFKTKIIGKYNVLLPDSDEVREHLDACFPLEVDGWYLNVNIQNEIQKMAKDKYFKTDCNEALDMIDNMTSDEVKEYLKKLIKEDPIIGIEIIIKGED